MRLSLSRRCHDVVTTPVRLFILHTDLRRQAGSFTGSGFRSCDC